MQRDRALLRSLIDAMPDLVFFKDTELVYRGCNKAFSVYAGIRESDLIGKTDLDISPVPAAERYQAHDRAALRAGQQHRNEEWLAAADGRQQLFDTVKTPYGGPDDVVLGISRDIIARKQAERIQAVQYAVSRILVQSRSLDETLEAVLEPIAVELGW